MRRPPRRPTIQKRLRIFTGCEGKSELGYTGWLSGISDLYGGRVHLVKHKLQGGSLISMVNKAIKYREGEIKKAPIFASFLFLDEDRGNENPHEKNKAGQIALEFNFKIVWQKPNHEGFLLLHCVEFQGNISASANEATNQLIKQKPAYEKPLSPLQYRNMFTEAGLKLAAQRHAVLATLLKEMGI